LQLVGGVIISILEGMGGSKYYFLKIRGGHNVVNFKFLRGNKFQKFFTVPIIIYRFIYFYNTMSMAQGHVNFKCIINTVQDVLYQLYKSIYIIVTKVLYFEKLDV
jgi:hypothetical protein